MNRLLHSLLAVLALAFCASVAYAAPTIGLQSGAPVQFSIPAGNFTTNYYIDVGTNPGQLSLNLSGGANVYLFLRYGTPFAETTFYNQPADLDLVTRYSHYYSVSATTSQSIVVLPSGYQPLRAGRWYVLVANSNATAAAETLTATLTPTAQNAGIQINFSTAGTDCDITPWNDTTPATPVGGNPGTTLGQQRRNALLQAAQLLSNQLASPVPITVQACWKHLGGDQHKATLAHAGPNTVILDDPQGPVPWLPEKYTWYSAAATSRLGGASLCGLGGDCSSADITATFNSDIGTSGVLGGEPFYLGYDNGPGNTEDFMPIAMHEMTHGLGFLGLVNDDPTMGTVGIRFSGQGMNGYDPPGFDDAFDQNVAIVHSDNTWVPFLDPSANDAARAAAMVSVTGLRWSGTEADDSPININYNLPAPANFVQLYAPCNMDKTTSCATEPGSTLSHLVQPGQLMDAFYQPGVQTLGLAQPMMHAMGWAVATATPPTYALPQRSNWYDRAHNGHGFDFQLVERDPVYGDLYYLTFYTYDANGNPELYSSIGHLIDGVFVGARDANGHTLERAHYDWATHSAVLDPGGGGDVVVDFNQAANSPACLSADRTGALQLGLMNWSLLNSDGSTTSEQWCVEPIVAASQHPTPDFNGHWYGGPNNSGWGMEIVEAQLSSGGPFVSVGLYYPDAQGTPRWAGAQTSNFVSGMTLQLVQVKGYCRTCTPQPLTTVPVGTIQLTLTQPIEEGVPSGVNRATINVSYPGTGGSFSQTNIPITLLSLPPGQ